MVGDKDVRSSLSYLPPKARYYFTQPSTKRAMDARELCAIGKELGLRGNTYLSVKTAYHATQSQAKENDIIFVGGSTFVVADLFASLAPNK